jgi:hypothetical protein
VVAGVVGVAMGALAWMIAAPPRRTEPGAEQLRCPYPVAQGRNVVNVILVDFRGVDTFGEIVVLAIAALGALALFRTGGAHGRQDARRAAGRQSGGQGAMRSLILERVARGCSRWPRSSRSTCCWRGHNQPGGGFIAGLVTGGAWCCRRWPSACAHALAPLAR